MNWRAFVFCILAMISSCAPHAVNPSIQERISQYDSINNKLASRRGYSTTVYYDHREIRLKGRRCTKEQLAQALTADITENCLSKEEFMRAPYSVIVIGRAEFRDLFSLLLLGETIGRFVKCFFYAGCDDGCSHTGAKNEDFAFRGGGGVLYVDDVPPECCCNLSLHNDGRLFVNGKEIINVALNAGCPLVGVDVLSKAMLVDKIIVLHVQGSTEVELVWRTINLFPRLGIRQLFMCCDEIESQAANYTYVKLKHQGRQMVLVGIPCPDDFYWGIVEEQVETID